MDMQILAELTNIDIERGAVLADVSKRGNYNSEGGAYATLRAVRTDIAEGK